MWFVCTTCRIKIWLRALIWVSNWWYLLNYVVYSFRVHIYEHNIEYDEKIIDKISNNNNAVKRSIFVYSRHWYIYVCSWYNRNRSQSRWSLVWHNILKHIYHWHSKNKKLNTFAKMPKISMDTYKQWYGSCLWQNWNGSVALSTRWSYYLNTRQIFFRYF